MLEILEYTFFRNALIGGTLIAFISSIMGVYVVMRKEANITHSISNFLFLGIAISILMSKNYYFYAFLFGLIASGIIFFIEKSRIITKESTKEIISQAGIAGGIFILGFLDNLSLDINNFLFGSILLINTNDLVILFIFFIILYSVFFIFGKKLLAVIVNEELAKSNGLEVNTYNFLFLVSLSIFISISIKIFGILMVGAFLVIPANTSKLIAKSIKQVFIYTFIFSFVSVIAGLFGSYYLDTSTGASIVLILLMFFILSVIYKKIRN